MFGRWAGAASRRSGRGVSTVLLSAMRDLATKMFAVLESNLFMGIVVAAGATGLIRFALHVARPDPILESAESRAGTAVDRIEVLRIWFPKTLVELARSPSRSAVIRTHGEFQRFLERRHEVDLWYAYADRVYQRNGQYCDCTYVKHPYKDPFIIQELRVFLAGVAENPPHFETDEFANVSFAVIPDKLVKHDTHIAVARLVDELYDSTAP
jgi:hypothetical protein